MKHLIIMLLAAIALTACRTTADTITHHHTAHADTTHRATLHTDTVRVADSLTVAILQRGDTVHITERRIIHRDRIVRDTDTLLQLRTDTVIVERHIPAPAQETKRPTVLPILCALSLIATLIFLYPKK